MSNAYSNFSTRKTPQTEPVPGEKHMTKNAAGGYVFETDKWDRLLRFLILGSEGGTYYVGEQKITRENALNVLACIKEDGGRTVSTIVGVSEEGRAPSNEPALFALALAIAEGSEAVRQTAEKAMPLVARTGTHLFHFVSYAENLRGWGRTLKRAVANWYQGATADHLAYQVVKYKSRDGWSHDDLLRLSHPQPKDYQHEAIYRYITKGTYLGADGLPDIILAAEEAKTADKRKVIKLILDYNLPREVVPTEMLNDPEVWEALLAHMPMTAMLRNLNKMTSVGLLTQLSDATRHVVGNLSDEARIRKARVHPITILVGMKTYAQGRGDKGSLTWNPVQKIVDALDEAFYSAFGNIPVVGNNIQLALDASGSMTNATISGLPLTVLEGAAVMALATAKVEPNHVITAYDMEKGTGFYSGRGIWPLSISPHMRLDAVIQYLRNNLKGGGTDSSLPFAWALAQKEVFSSFVIYSDNETWAGKVHPFQMLDTYRNKRNPGAMFVGVAMTASGYQTHSPEDNSSLSIVGFDSAAPQIISEFLRGEL